MLLGNMQSLQIRHNKHMRAKINGYIDKFNG